MKQKILDRISELEKAKAKEDNTLNRIELLAKIDELYNVLNLIEKKI
jgi:hypothetical protein